MGARAGRQARWLAGINFVAAVALSLPALVWLWVASHIVGKRDYLVFARPCATLYPSPALWDVASPRPR